MTSRERLLAAINGAETDHVPLTTWCFGLQVPERLRWANEGGQVDRWYSMRMEHLHTLTHPWTLDDDFRRVKAWQALGVDDVLDVSVPWSVDPAATWTVSKAPAGEMDAHPVLIRDYQTPAGAVRHAVRQTQEEPGEGWPIQPGDVPLFEDYNIPRAVEHAVSSPKDVAAMRYLYAAPDDETKRWFADRMATVKAFADEKGVLVQAWSGFGMDAVVWLTGTEGAIMMAMDAPDAFGELIEIVAETDCARTELAALTDGVDVVVERGWYSSTDFWSPTLFDTYVFDHTKRMADIAHKHGKKFAYVMTTGVEALGPRLADAGVDVLYFVDPVQDGIKLETARDLLGDRMTLVGGTNAVSLLSDDTGRIEREVTSAIDVLAPTKRFILHPLDAVFPDTPWTGIKRLIDAWRKRW